MSWAQEPDSHGRHALAGLRQARQLLVRPQSASLEACLPHLETAARELSSLENQLRFQPPSSDCRRRIHTEIRQLQDELHRLRALMENAGRFYSGLGQLLAAAGGAPAYTPEGRLEAGGRPPRLRVEG